MHLTPKQHLAQLEGAALHTVQRARRKALAYAERYSVTRDYADWAQADRWLTILAERLAALVDIWQMQQDIGDHGHSAVCRSRSGLADRVATYTEE